MAIGPVEMNGYITRTQDIGTMKHQEDSKPVVDQQNFQAHFKEEVQANMKNVHHADDSDNHQKKFDAKEKGSNEYYNNRKDKKNDSGKNEDKKKKNSTPLHRFDMSI